MDSSKWIEYQDIIRQLEAEGRVKRTFRRLDPTRQQAVINAILEEAAEKGPAALNMKTIADRAGVAIGSLYQYFPNREGLLGFAVELCVRSITTLFEMALPYLQSMPLADALRSTLSYGLEWGQAESGLVRFFGRAAYQGDPILAERLVRPVAQAMRNLTFHILTAAKERGEISPGIDLEAASRLVNGLLIVVGDSQMLPYLNTYFQISDESSGGEEMVTTAVGFILKALR